MAKIKLEYLWLDGYYPTQNLRSKTKVEEHEDFKGTLEELGMWSFDGSSTRQAEGGSSDCLLKPVAIYPDPARINGYLVMTEVLNADGTPHVSNGRATIDDDDNDFWFGFEQEYFIMDTKTQLPLGFPVGGYPGPQGMYYCSVGGKNTWGRDLVERHADLCIDAGLNFEGINGKDMDWNGSGMHANFSNTTLRTCGDKDVYAKICESFRSVVDEHIEVYGEFNDQRLTGLHETAAITDFSWGVSDRGASIRIPIIAVEKGWKGLLTVTHTKLQVELSKR